MLFKSSMSGLPKMENIPAPPKKYHIKIMYKLLSDIEKWDNEQEYKLRNDVINSLSEYLEVIKAKNPNKEERYQNDTSGQENKSL